MIEFPMVESRMIESAMIESNERIAKTLLMLGSSAQGNAMFPATLPKVNVERDA
jgi:hypothetical protein